MRKNRIITFLSLLCVCATGVYAQISHGGKPLLMDNFSLRNSQEVPFVEMPSFDRDSVLISDGLESQNLRTHYPFAYKFMTNIRKGIDGTETILLDGTKVWQVGIHSEGAYSLNLLFTEYDIPPGGKLFIYNTDHTHLIGSFDHRNNSPAGMLPIRPVSGDKIIIEYSEPADAPYPARLVIGEVNHDYRDIMESPMLRREPSADLSAYRCMPDVLCEQTDERNVRATVLLMINGTAACTGTLINNTGQDKTPYLLTAVHCLNPNTIFPQEMDYYIERAGTIVTFFNYNRQVCGSTMKATQDMSTAITYPRVIIENKDIALLELQEKPPLTYNAYYAGWDINTTANQPPYTNIHHPGGGVKKFGITGSALTLTSWSTSSTSPFDRDSHWRVASWQIGSTHGGSSGSPLFSPEGLIIGGLTGGSSTCLNTYPNGNSDFFFALHKGWETNNASNQLKTYLDPQNKGVKKLAGLDPNRENPLIRLSNMQLNTRDTLATTTYKSPNSGFLFGNSNRKITEFAEKFSPDTTSILHGVYIFIPAMQYSHTNNVEITVYAGNKSPERLLTSQTFTPRYLNYRAIGSGKDFTYDPASINSVPTEHFVAFDEPVYLGEQFFIGYKINYSTGNKFVIYNTGSTTGNPPNTAWLKDENGQWIAANEYAAQPISTSLALQPLVQYTDEVSIPDIQSRKNDPFMYLRGENQLLIPETQTHGNLYIYSINGQLIEQIPVAAGERSLTVKASTAGTVAIVRMTAGDEVYTGKIIY
ncbi:MAG: trypsin-like peptidase domain-containing protein [Bacteroidales bacterium]|nr:trypsin-like peptidase domain-containing protein [Bacteroidales bacterium]